MTGHTDRTHTHILICRDAPYYVRSVWKLKQIKWSYFSDAPYIVWGVSIYQDVCVLSVCPVTWIDLDKWISVKTFQVSLIGSHSLLLASRKHNQCIWSILPRVGKICNIWSKTRNTFCVIATKLHFQISWLMSLCKRNYPFVMCNV